MSLDNHSFYSTKKRHWDRMRSSAIEVSSVHSYSIIVPNKNILQLHKKFVRACPDYYVEHNQQISNIPLTDITLFIINIHVALKHGQLLHLPTVAQPDSVQYTTQAITSQLAVYLKISVDPPLILKHEKVNIFVFISSANNMNNTCTVLCLLVQDICLYLDWPFYRNSPKDPLAKEETFHDVYKVLTWISSS